MQEAAPSCWLGCRRMIRVGIRAAVSNQRSPPARPPASQQATRPVDSTHLDKASVKPQLHSVVRVAGDDEACGMCCMGVAKVPAVKARWRRALNIGTAHRHTGTHVPQRAGALPGTWRRACQRRERREALPRQQRGHGSGSQRPTIVHEEEVVRESAVADQHRLASLQRPAEQWAQVSACAWAGGWR